MQVRNLTYDLYVIFFVSFKNIAMLNIGTLELIPIEHFTSHVRLMHLDGDSRFETEYDMIKEKDPKGNDDIAREHTSKNRYVNIFTCTFV